MGLAAAADDYLRRCFASGTTVRVTNFAQELDMPLYQLIRYFSKERGEPPNQYFRRAQVRRTRQVLARTNWMIEDVARAAGFGSRATLHRVFRNATGQTPEEYRDEHRNNRRGRSESQRKSGK